jgi:hypothetical protein
MLAAREVEKLKQKVADLTKSLESLQQKRPLSEKLQWICGGNPDLECRREINRGSFGCVYEVDSFLKVSLLPFLLRSCARMGKCTWVKLPTLERPLPEKL